MSLLVFLLFNFFTHDIVFRAIFPLFWLLNNFNYSTVYILLGIYLIFYIFLDAIMLIHFTGLFQKFYIIKNKNIINKEIKTNFKFFEIVIIISIICFILIAKKNIIGILGEHGSDTLLYLEREHKFEIWLLYGIISILGKFFLVISLFDDRKYVCIISLILSFFINILGGKKSGFYNFFLNIIFLNALSKGIKPFFVGRRVTFSWIIKSLKECLKYFGLFVSSIIFFYFILIKTLKFTKASNFYDTLIFVLSSIYSSSTIYLDQIIKNQGLNYIEKYSDMLGEYGIIKYFLNPFTKFLFNIGIYKAIGPYLSEMLYGYEIAYGVNPTLFFEFCFILGDIYQGFITSIMILFLITVLKFIFINKMYKIAYNFEFKNISNFDFSVLIIFYINTLLFIFSFKIDTLNSIRSYFFTVLLYLLFILYKILPRLFRKIC